MKKFSNHQCNYIWCSSVNNKVKKNYFKSQSQKLELIIIDLRLVWEYPVSPPNFHLIALSVALHVCSTNILSFGIFKTIASRGLAFQSFLQNFLITGKHTKKKRKKKTELRISFIWIKFYYRARYF